MPFKERRIVLMHLSENIRVIVARDRLFDFVWGMGWGRDYFDPGFFFFAHRSLAFYFSARSMRIKTKQKKLKYLYI